MPWRTASNQRRVFSALMSPKTATTRRCWRRVTTCPARVRYCPKRASTPTLTSRHWVFPFGVPSAGRSGTITPSAPSKRGRPACSGASASSGGSAPVASASSWSWSRAMARWPAACTHPQTAWGLTRRPLYQPSNVAAVANGTNTAKAHPRAWRSPLVRCAGESPRSSSKGATCGMEQPCGQRPTRRRHRSGPKRLVIWRVTKPVRRRHAPQTGQGGQDVGRRARSVSTYSTTCLARTRANGHTATSNAVSVCASSTAQSHGCRDGSWSRMISVRHSIGIRPPVETWLRGSTSVSYFRCYASPPPTKICALHCLPLGARQRPETRRDKVAAACNAVCTCDRAL